MQIQIRVVVPDISVLWLADVQFNGGRYADVLESGFTTLVGR